MPKIVCIITILALTIISCAMRTCFSRVSIKESPQSGLNSKNLNYSINLMWINSYNNQKQNYLCPPNNKFYMFNKDWTGDWCEEDNAEAFLRKMDPVFIWAQQNPTSTVNFWFDSYLTPSSS